MNAYCEHCGHRFPAMDSGVRYRHDEGIFECTDEIECFERRAIQQTTDTERAAMQRGLDDAFAVLDNLTAEGWRL